MEIIIGIISGIVTGLGMGGGTVLILLLDSIVKINQLEAQAVNLIFFIPASLIAIIINYKNKNIDIKLAVKIILFGIVGTICGILIANNIGSNSLKKCFSVFILCIGIYEIIKVVKNHKEYRLKINTHNNKKEN